MDDITISFSDGPDSTTQSNATSPLGEGFHKKEESQNELFERLFNDMTETMLDIFNLLSGKGDSGNNFMDKIRDTASAILNNESSDNAEDPSKDKAKKSFTKATKLSGLEATDINIVDQQWILGSLLVNSTLLRIETLLEGLVGSPKASLGKKPKAKNKEESDTENDKLKKFKNSLSEFNDLNNLAQVVIPVLMANMKMVKWELVFTFFKNFRKALTTVKDIANEFDKDKSKLEGFVKITKELIGGIIIVALGISMLAIFLPLLLVGTASAYIMTLAIKPILEVVDKIATSKNIDKFDAKAGHLAHGLLSMLAAITLLAIMLPMLPLAIVSALLLSVTVLSMRLVLLVMPSAASVIKGTLSALFLAVFFGALALAVYFVHKAGTDIKKTLLGMAVIGIVAVGGAALAMILGIPFILGLVLLGTVTALSLVVFFTAIMFAIKAVAKTGQYTDAALAALGHISRRSVNGNDGTEHKDDTGILGFFSRLASWTFIKALLVSVLTNALLALNGLALYIAATLLKSAFNVMANISDEYFPVDVDFRKTKPGAAIIAVRLFSEFIAGKVNAKGEPITNGEPIVGWTTLLEIAPLVVFGILLMTAGKTLQEGLKEFNKFDADQLSLLQDKVKELGKTLRAIRENLSPQGDESKSTGFISWILRNVLHSDDIADAIEWFTACFPLFTLMLYGYLLEQAAVPLKKGIDALADINTTGVTPDKMKTIGDAINGIIKPLEGFTSTFTLFGDKTEQYLNIVNAICGLVEAFPSLMEIIVSLSKMNMSEIQNGLGNFAYLLAELIGTPEARNYWEQMWGLNKSNAASEGSLLSALSSIKDNNIVVKPKLFEPVIDLLEQIAPISAIVISFANLSSEQLENGINGIKTIINCAKDITTAFMGNSGGDDAMSALNKVLSIADTNAKAKVSDNNPLFAIVDLFNNLGNMDTFIKNVGTFKTAMLGITESFSALENLNMAGFTRLQNAVTNDDFLRGINAIGRLVSYKSSIDVLATSFDRLGESLEKIAEIDTTRLTEVISETNASAIAVIKAQRETEANTQSTVVMSAVDEYVRYISEILGEWEANGISIRQANAPRTAIVPPRVNNATTAGYWGT